MITSLSPDAGNEPLDPSWAMLAVASDDLLAQGLFNRLGVHSE